MLPQETLLVLLPRDSGSFRQGLCRLPMEGFACGLYFLLEARITRGQNTRLNKAFLGSLRNEDVDVVRERFAGQRGYRSNPGIPNQPKTELRPFG
jgi:hypothetical protein